MSVDLPALGKPTRATSAARSSSRSYHASSPRLTLLGEGRCPPAVGEEAGVASPAAAPGPGQPPVPGRGEVAEDGAVLTTGPGTRRDRDLEVTAPGPVAALATAVATVSGSPMGMVAEAEQGRLVGRGHQPHVAAPAAVTAIGPAPIDVRLAPECDRAGTAVTRFHMDLRLVDEPGHRADPTDALVTARDAASGGAS